MRKCSITPMYHVGGEWHQGEPKDALFHQFATETNDDGHHGTYAVVEYIDGKVDSVPITWLTLLPQEAIPGVLLDAKSCHSEEVIERLRESLDRLTGIFKERCHHG